MMELGKFSKILSPLLIAASLAGCCTPEVLTETKYIYYYTPEVPRPAKLNLLPVEFDAVSYKNIDEYIEENKKRNGVLVFLAMDVLDYENLAYNTAESSRWINQANAILSYYEDYHAPKEKVDETE